MEDSMVAYRFTPTEDFNPVDFNSSHPWVHHLDFESVEVDVDEGDAISSSNTTRSAGLLLLVHWEPPPLGSFKLNTDGCSKGNPGDSGSGGIIRDSSGSFIAAFTDHIGFQSAVFSELWALYQGLRLSLDVIGIDATLWIESDSVEVVSVILGQHGPHYIYINIVESCREIISLFKNVKVNHVYREANKAADFLANASLFHETGFKIWETPNSDLEKLVYEDGIGVATPRVCKGLCKTRFYM